MEKTRLECGTADCPRRVCGQLERKTTSNRHDRRNDMRTLFGVVFLILIGIAVAGFYRGWFHFSTNSADQTSSATITVDQNKIRADESKVKERAKEFDEKMR